MLLVLDVGNTHIHVGVYRGEELLATGKLSTEKKRTPDEFSLLLGALLSERGIGKELISETAVACVVPPVVTTVEETIRGTFGHDPLFIDHESGGDLLSLFSDPKEVGADRIANAVGGYRLYGGPLIVVDFGTATTFDAVSAEGRYLGGVIAPGLAISIDALFRHAARLPRIELRRPNRVLGRDTVTSMQSGIVFGYAGLVDAIVERIRGEIDGVPAVIATGGMARLIVKETGVVKNVDDHLTLHGIRLVHEAAGNG